MSWWHKTEGMGMSLNLCGYCLWISEVSVEIVAREAIMRVLNCNDQKCWCGCGNSMVVIMGAGLIWEFCRNQSVLYLVHLGSFYMESAISNPVMLWFTFLVESSWDYQTTVLSRKVYLGLRTSPKKQLAYL